MGAYSFARDMTALFPGFSHEVLEGLTEADLAVIANITACFLLPRESISCSRKLFRLELSGSVRI